MNYAVKKVFGSLVIMLLMGNVCAQIWPGDVSNNGLVDGIDWLYYGVAFGEQGPQRTETSSMWARHNEPELWGDDFPEGHNFAYADCNGDGLVDDSDGATINLNFGLFRDTVIAETLSTGNLPNDPSLFFSDHRRDTIEAYPGANLIIPVSLGDAEVGVTRFYGLRTEIIIDSMLSRGTVEAIRNPNAWTGPVLQSQQTFIDHPSIIDLAITRFDGNESEGFGKIMDLSLVIEEDLVFIEQPEAYFNIYFRHLKFVDKELNNLPLVADTLTVKLYRDSTSLITTRVAEQNAAGVRLYPNPATDYLYIETEAIDLQHIVIYNSLGQAVKQLLPQYFNDKYRRLALGPLAAGIYWLNIRHSKGLITRKIIIQSGNH